MINFFFLRFLPLKRTPMSNLW